MAAPYLHSQGEQEQTKKFECTQRERSKQPVREATLSPIQHMQKIKKYTKKKEEKTQTRQNNVHGEGPNVRAHGRRQSVRALQVVDQLLQRHADALDLDAVPQRPLEVAILQLGHLVPAHTASEKNRKNSMVYLSEKGSK